MPNVANPEAARAFARKVSARIPDPDVAHRLETLAFLHLLQDARNLRPVAAHEWETLPDWADNARQRGETVYLFALHRGSAQRVQIAARRLAAAWDVARADAEHSGAHREAICAARKFMSKIDHMDFEATMRKAYAFWRLHREWADDRDDNGFCESASAPATQDRTWRRITSLGKLRSVGRELRNCLANATRRSAYGAALVSGDGQFWVLRDSTGAGLMLAFASHPAGSHFREVKGPRNASVNLDHPDLVGLAAKLGMKPLDHPPPTPPDPLPPVSLEALRACLRDGDALPSARARILLHLTTPLRRNAAGH
ncbi:MAG: hypothetical protein K2P58_04625 [Hyphomonadaceae bacterium]|nr:hypothetical protein [Hyphomonadaceae bacterium]